MQDFKPYLINLASRKDRYACMMRQLKQLAWTAEIFPAVRPAERGDFETIGARGCFMSHLGVLRKACGGAQHVILLEDDLNFVEDFAELWPVALEALSQVSWSIFYPGHLLKNVPPGLHCVDAVKGLWCTHFLVIHKDSIARVASALETILSRPAGHPSGGPMHVDAAYNLIRQQNPDLATYIYSPTLGYQRSSRSDVSDHRWFDRIEPLRPVVDLLRKLKKSGKHRQDDEFL